MSRTLQQEQLSSSEEIALIFINPNEQDAQCWELLCSALCGQKNAQVLEDLFWDKKSLFYLMWKGDRREGTISDADIVDYLVFLKCIGVMQDGEQFETAENLREVQESFKSQLSSSTRETTVDGDISQVQREKIIYPPTAIWEQNNVQVSQAVGD
jgi:hypothetical protein